VGDGLKHIPLRTVRLGQGNHCASQVVGAPSPQPDAGQILVEPFEGQPHRRMEAETVTALDEARVRLGLKNRVALIRRALQAYLDQAGEREVAALLSDCPGEDG